MKHFIFIKNHKDYIQQKIVESTTNYLYVYHGTNTKYVDAIKSGGLLSRVGYDTSNWYMVSTDFESALYHATPIEKGNVYVFQFKIPIVKNDMWCGYPYLWAEAVISDNSKWFAIKKPLTSDMISNVYEVDYDKWLERKNLKY